MATPSFRLVHVALAPLRALPQDASEMVSQLLFGELVEVLERTDKWTRVRNLADGYEGWLDPKQVFEVSADWVAEHRFPVYLGVRSSVASCERDQSGEPILLPLGATLHLKEPFADQQVLTMEIPRFKMEISVQNWVQRTEPDRDSVLFMSGKMLGAPYLWGGKSYGGVDCSGLTQVCYRLAGLPLPRDASQQVHLGQEIPFVEALPGDLAFFQNFQGKVIHVGIVLPEGRIRHAHGWVREDLLTPLGVFNAQRIQTHVFHSIRRLIT